MKSYIKFTLLLAGLIMFQFSFCQKDPSPKIDCLVSTAELFNRKLEFTYDTIGRVIQAEDFYDTVYAPSYGKVINYIYNSDGLILSVNEYDLFGGLVDSIAYEYIGKSTIIERQYYWQGDGKYVCQRDYKINSQNYITSDTCYEPWPFRSMNLFTLYPYEFSNYEYDEKGNVIKFNHSSLCPVLKNRTENKVNNSNKTDNGCWQVDLSISYEYSDTLIPNNSYSIARFTFTSPILPPNDRGVYYFILAHRTNLVAKETQTTNNDTITINHSYVLDSNKYPLKDDFARYTYKCTLINILRSNHFSEILLIPNPVTAELKVILDSMNEYTDLDITDINGREVYKEKIETGSVYIRINTVKLSIGTYILKLKGNNVKKSLRFIKN